MSLFSITPPPPDIANRIRWYVKIRWIVLALVSIPVIGTLYIGEGFSGQVKRDTILAASAIASNIVFYVLAHQKRSLRFYKIVGLIMLACDVAVVSGIIFIKGGIESRSVILYTLPILMSAAIFGKRPVYNTALACAVSYNFILIGDYLGWFSSLGAYNPELRLNLPYVINSSVFMTISLLIISAMVNFINRLLVEQEAYALESLNAMKLAQSIARLGSWEWDVKRDILRWPGELNQIFGVHIPEEHARREDALRVIHPDDRRRFRRSLRQSLTSKNVFSIEHRVLSSGGRVRHALTEGKPLASRNGRVTKVIGTTRDITETKVLDEAKTDFVSLASHQLRTPATGVKQYLGMLLENYTGKLTVEQRDLVAIAYESNERQLTIVDDLLSVAQIDSDRIVLKLARCDVVKLIKNVIQEQKPKFENKQQKIVFKPVVSSLVIKADKQRLRMVLDNIIDNASKYSSDGSTVDIAVKDLPSEITIAIKDRGVGIAKSDIDKLFHKFSRIENPVSTVVGGTGLGLYLAGRIVDMHAGKIEVTSKLGKSTTFIIHLPKEISLLQASRRQLPISDQVKLHGIGRRS